MPRIDRYARHGPTASVYWRAITRTTWRVTNTQTYPVPFVFVILPRAIIAAGAGRWDLVAAEAIKATITAARKRRNS